MVLISINGQNNKYFSSWPSWFGCVRSLEAVGKDFLLCTVNGPEYKDGAPIDLSQYTVSDIIIRRWVASQNRKKP